MTEYTCTLVDYAAAPNAYSVRGMPTSNLVINPIDYDTFCMQFNGSFIPKDLSPYVGLLFDIPVVLDECIKPDCISVELNPINESHRYWDLLKGE